jgi:DNA recombination protein RmuC
MDVINLVLLVIIAVLCFILIVKLFIGKSNNITSIDRKDKEEIMRSFSYNVSIISSALQASAENSSKVVKANLDNMSEKINENRKATEERFYEIEKKLEYRLEQIRQTLERNVQVMRENNEKKLEEIQKTVDEKLTKTLNDRFNESFKVLSDELAKVTLTIGEMQKISSDVGNLSKMLSNVKTTGILGEIQLGAIIDEILSPEQYIKNVVTNKAGREPVEFAVKLPGGDDGEVLLPIDSKFPYIIYTDMQTAYEQNDFEEFEAKKKQLINTIKSMARDIKEKYINPPITTNFAVMFLPVEGLYAEVVKLGLVEELRTKHNITVAGPTTMAALLNSLQMGFQTLAIQKKSNEVWTILGAVKAEFAKFGAIIENIQKKLNGASNDLDQLLGVRTRAIDRSLRNVTITGDNNLLNSADEEII